MKTKLFLLCGVPVLALMMLGPLAGCEVTSEKIQTWKQTVKGAAKIRAAVRDTGQKMPIRVEAAEALCEMGLFVPLTEDLKALGAADRKQLVDALVKRLISVMEGSNPGATTRVQIQAKDALFSLRDMAGDPLQKSIDDKLSRWITGDWQQRNTGEHSADKIVVTLGEAAGPALVDAMGQGTPLVVASTLLRKVGGQDQRDRAAEKLIEQAKQEQPPKVQTIEALGKVGSPKALEFLTGLARKGAMEQRKYALRALALFPHVSVLPLVRAIAADESLKDEDAILRDEAFTVMEKISDPKSLEALLGFLPDKNKLVRYRAVEAIVSGFGEKGLTKLLEGLPSGYTYPKEDLEDFVEKVIHSELGKRAVPALREALGSKNWVARLVAARMLGRLGAKQDVTSLKKLGSDNTRLQGWEGGATVGSEALGAAKQLESR